MTHPSINYDEAVARASKILFAYSQTGRQHSFSMIDDGGLRATMLQLRGVTAIRSEPQKILNSAKRDSDEFDALLWGAAHHLWLGFELPDAVRRWVADFLMGRIERPTGKDGRPKKTGLHSVIFGLVQRFEQQGMTATRNNERAHLSNKDLSACDAVAGALDGLGITPKTYKGVKDIWLEYKKKLRPDGGMPLVY